MDVLDELKLRLKLQPLPMEGGFFSETYRSTETLPDSVLWGTYSGARSVATAIYYLLTSETFSALHRLPTDEIFHFYAGDPVDMLQLHPDGRGKVIRLGNDVLGGARPQVVAPKGVWQGSRLAPGGSFALLGTTMAPGFEFNDYEGGERSVLVKSHPEFRELIVSLTRNDKDVP